MNLKKKKKPQKFPIHRDTPHIPLDLWFLSDENSTELEQTMRQGQLCNMR